MSILFKINKEEMIRDISVVFLLLLLAPVDVTTCPKHGTDPDMSREGGSIPVTITLQEASGKNVLLLPMGAGDDMAHSQNEKLNVRNYIEGIKLFAAYLVEVGKLAK